MQKISHTDSRFNHVERRGITALAAIYIVRMLGLFMILPVFAIYAESLPAATPLLTGLAIGIYGLAQACLQIPLGLLSDRIGRKPVIIAGLLLFIIGSVIAALADNIYWIIVGRFVQGSGAVAAAIMALASDLTRDTVRTKAMAIIGVSIGGAFLFALIIGPMLYQQVGMNGIFWVTAGLAGFAIILSLTVLPDIKSTPITTQAAGSLKRVLSDPQLLHLNIGVFVLHWLMTATFIAVPLILHNQQGLQVSSHSLVYLGVFIVSFIVMWPLLKLADGNKLRWCFPLVVGLLALAEFALGYSQHTMIFFLISLVLYFTAFNWLEATMPSLVSKLAEPVNKGVAMGAFSASQFIGAFAGGVMGGWVIQQWGIGGLFWVNSLLALVWCMLTLVTYKNQSNDTKLLQNQESQGEIETGRPGNSERQIAA